MKISILNLYACGNIGDETVLTVVAEKLISSFPKTNINLLALSPAGMFSAENIEQLGLNGRRKLYRNVFYPLKNNRRFNWVFFIARLGLLRVAIRLWKSDIVIYGGGYWLHDYRFKTLLFSLLPAIFSKVFRKKVVFLSIGAGPIKGKFSKWLVNSVLKKCDATIARDEFSKKALVECGFLNVKTAADPAFLFKSDLMGRKGDTALLCKLNENRPLCGFSVCAWYKMKFYYQRNILNYEIMYENLACFFDMLIEKDGINVIFVPTMFPEDLIASQEIIKRIRNKEKIILLEEMYSPDETAEFIAKCDYFISMRLHPLIFALKNHTPVLAINYSEKVESLMKNLHLERNLLDMEDEFLSVKDPKFAHAMHERFGVLKDISQSDIENIIEKNMKELEKKAVDGFDMLKDIIKK